MSDSFLRSSKIIFCRKPEPTWTCKSWGSRMQTELFVNPVYTFSLMGWIVIRWTNYLIILRLIWDWKELAMYWIGQWRKNSSRRSYEESSRIKELKKLCSAEAERVKQKRTDEFSIQQKVSLQWINSRFKFRNYKTRWILWAIPEKFFDPETASSSGLSHIPSQRVSIPSPCGMTCRDSCLHPDTRNSFDTSGNVLKTYLLRVNLQQLSVQIREVQHNASPCLWTQGDLPIEQMNWREILIICSTETEICKGIFNLESSLSCRRSLSAELHGWTAEESRLRNGWTAEESRLRNAFR